MVIDGKKIANKILSQIKEGVAQLPFVPVFCDCLVGNDPASMQYVAMKASVAQKAGFKFRSANFPSEITTEKLVEEIKNISLEPNICGLIIQLPLPGHINTQAVLNAVNPKIDVDCTGEVNSNLFYSGNPYVEFPTAAAIIEILNSVDVNFKTQHFLVMGQGQLVGKPVSFLLNQKGATVDVAESKTKNTDKLLQQADIIISAVGKAKLITGDKIKKGAIIVDAGTSEGQSGIVGDVDFESIKGVAKAVSPTPGGVGPVTVAKLLANVLKVAQNIANQAP